MNYKEIMLRLLNGNALILIIAFFTLLPFLIISVYNQPSADDFCLGHKFNLIGVWEAFIDRYTNWTGRYLASFLLLVHPLSFNSLFLYKVYPIIFLLLIVLSFYHLTKTVFKFSGKKETLLITSLLLISYFIDMPSISQGLYWLPGSISYQLANILFIYLIVCIIKLLETAKITYLFISILILFLIIGLNETSMLLTVFTISFIFAYNYFYNHKISYHLIVLLFFAIIFSTIVISSPGNTIREAFFPERHQFLLSFKYTILSSSISVINWLPIFLFGTIIIWDYLNRSNLKLNSYFEKIPGYVILVFIMSLFIIGFFPAYWSMGGGPPKRTENVLYFFLTVALIYFIVYAYFKLQSKNKKLVFISPVIKYFGYTLVIINFISSNNMRKAYSDLYSGRAKAYNQEIEMRYDIISSSNKDNIIVPKLKNKPHTIYFEDITVDANDWKNNCYANYFKSNAIKIKE